MANSTKLSLTFARSTGESVTFTYNHAKKEAGAANVKSLMEGIIANNAIFEKAPVSIKSAKFVTVEETAVDLS
ncbi:MAG: DUF2922 domain-containing protein [Synergistaceae bacterium]|nr:DUF2922 domain-containing protein [Synergistaceae bacterium]